MRKIIILIFCLHGIVFSKAQPVEVRADYNSLGDCIFSAHNNAKTPMFLKIDFADLENTSFNEPLPYVKKLVPGFNDLFTLERILGADVPRFNYQIKTFRSNPTSIVNLDFPYLLPFAPGQEIKGVDVKSIKGFRGNTEPKSWLATGFEAKPGDDVYASRQGEIVEIAGARRGENTQDWYNTWNYSITLLQEDGTLICYRNVVDKGNNLQLNQKIYAGQLLGKISPGATELIMLIYQHSLSSDDIRFIIPQFSVDADKQEFINVAKTYKVVHPNGVRGLEMSKKERKRILGKKK